MAGVELKHEQKVYPGDKFKIVDDGGEEFYIDCEDDPAFIALALAVDGLIVSRSFGERAFEEAWLVLRRRFEEVPHRVLAQLRGGVGDIQIPQLPL